VPAWRPDRPEEPLVLLDAAGLVLDTLAEGDLEKASLIIMSLRGASVSDYQPFDDNPLCDAGPNGSGLVIVERPAAAETKAWFRVTLLSGGRTPPSREPTATIPSA